MFMLVTYSSKVILYVSSDGSSTTFSLRYGSYDTIWRDKQEKGTQENNTSAIVS
jgi:hypothetical protein